MRKDKLSPRGLEIGPEGRISGHQEALLEPVLIAAPTRAA